MERLEDEYSFALEEDENEKRIRDAKERKNKKKKRRLLRRRGLLIILIGLLAFYMLSSYSNIRVVDVSGSNFYNKTTIMSKAKIKFGTKTYLAPSLLIAHRLNSDPVIKSTKVSKSLNGIVRITITEEKLLGYYKKDGKAYLVIEGKDDQYIEDEKSLATVPYLVDLDSDTLAAYEEALNEIDAESIRLISEVSIHKTSYDENMLELTMQDGHIVYTSIEGLKNLDYYNEILKGLKTTHKCIVFAEENNAAYSQKCE